MKRDAGLQLILLNKEKPTLDGAFEDRMMAQIHQRATVKSSDRRYLRLMYMFFALGLMFGILVSFTVIDREFTFGDITITVNRLLLLIPLVVVLLFLFEKIYRIKLFREGKEKIFDI